MATLSRRKLAATAARQIAVGESKETVLQRIAAYLIDSHRVGEVELIARDIEAALVNHGTVVGTVVSARPLTKESRESISTFVKQQYANVKNVVLREQVDESVIGGVRIELPDQQLDATVMNKLDKLMA